jgi:glycosyltransferase involved in cell wall biosynthesis
MLSRLEKEKNIDLGIYAFKRFLNFYPNARLIIAGKGRQTDDLISLVQFLHLDKKVSFVGWERNTKKLFAKADIFLHTSYYEGFGLVLLEAVASLLPVVSTDVGIARDLGAKIVPYDPGQVALSINDIVANPNQQVGLQNYQDFVLTREKYLESYKSSFM